MKKIAVYLLILSVVLLNFTGCDKGQDKKTSSPSAALATSIKESGTCNVSVEPKVELLAVVQYLADDQTIEKNRLNNEQEKYSKDINEYFSKYKDEPVVKLYEDMWENGYCFDAPPASILYTDDNFKFLPNLTIPEDLLLRSGGKDKLSKFFDSLVDFRKKSKFDEFFIKHKDYYTSLVSPVKEKVDKLGCIDQLVKYYGYKQNSYNIIIEPLSTGGYGPRIQSKDGKFDLYDFMVVPSVDTEFFNLVVHEFGHSYVNPLTAKNLNEVNNYNKLFDPIKESMAKQHYGDWETSVNEHIVRAVTYRAMYKSFGTNVYFTNMDKNNGFNYLDAISEKLKEYENNRDKYPTFNDFYPQILELFKELSSKQNS